MEETGEEEEGEILGEREGEVFNENEQQEEEEEEEEEEEKEEDKKVESEYKKLLGEDNYEGQFSDYAFFPKLYPKFSADELGADWLGEYMLKDYVGEQVLPGVEVEYKRPCTPEDESSNLDQQKSEESSEPSEALSNVYKKLSPFNLEWSFGVKKNIELINLTCSNSFEVFYVSSHYGVIFNYCTNQMIFLPGHNFPITCIASDTSGRWLVSADAGEDTVIIIWDNKKRIPVWSLYNVFPNEGVKCVKISQDARFLAAMNCKYNFVLKFWLWTYGREEPDGVIEIDPAYKEPKHIDFNHMDTEQFIATMEYNVIFCEWIKEQKKLNSYAPDFKHKKKFGVFRHSLFLDDNHTCLTSTSEGQVVVWCDVHYTKPIDETVPGTIEKKYLKAVKLHKSGITSLQLCEKIIISSSEDGIILFHDQLLRLVYWLPKLKLDPLVSVSFHIEQTKTDPFCPEFSNCINPMASDEEIENVFEYDLSMDHPEEVRDDDEEPYLQQDTPKTFIMQESKEVVLKDPSDCTLEMRPFALRDFVFLTMTGRIGYVSHKRKKARYYLYEAEAPVLSVDCSPHKEYLVMGNSQGHLSLYNYVLKKRLSTVTLPAAIVKLKYSYQGYYLMACLENGVILELDPILLKINSELKVMKSLPQKICFSLNDEFLAFYDESSLVCVYVKTPAMRSWTFMGNYYSHYKPIRDMLFEDTLDPSRNPRLFTIGEDRMLVEYDLKLNSEEKLNILSRVRIEQSAIPLAFTWLHKFYKTPQFIISNNDYKLKVMDATTNVCQKTTMGPTADTPIDFMKVIVDDQSESRCKMIYTTEKHLGIRILPPTGNPFEGMGMIAHPEKLVAVAVSYDFKYVFTAGANDCSLLMWKVNPNSVEVASQLGGVGLEPYVSLIEGGSNSFLFKEIEDFFYYAQIIHQGEDPNLNRSVSKNLALCEIPDMFRSLGYYPTDYEITNLLYELKHLKYEETGEFTTEISFEECVKAFLNHRPFRGVSMEHLNKALLTIADVSDPSDIIVEKTELYKALEENAEAMDHAEVVGYLCILLLPKDENNPVPPSMPLSDFAENVLGIDLSITEENVREVTHAFELKKNQ